MGEKVIVVLDRGPAEQTVQVLQSSQEDSECQDCSICRWEQEALAALRAALGRDREASDRALAEMYAEVRKEPKEGTISAAIKCHSQACGLVAYAFDVHPDSVARAVAAIEQADQEEGDRG